MDKQLKFCECGCGNVLPYKSYHKYKEPLKYIHGHNHRNKTYISLYGKKAQQQRKARARYGIDHHSKIKSLFRWVFKDSTAEFVPWNKGKKMSEEHREKLSKARIKGLAEGRITTWHKGRTNVYTKERLAKLKIERSKRKVPYQDSKIELKIQSYLKELGFSFFTHHYIDKIKHAYRCDLFIPCLNTIIECDGDYWHKYPIGKDLDHIRTKELIEQGFKVLRLWESEIKPMTIKQFKNRIQNEI